MNANVCSLFYTPLGDFLRCATPFDWTLVLILLLLGVGPIMAICVRIAHPRARAAAVVATQPQQHEQGGRT
jgi:cytochrome c oxidase subunit IV